MAMALPLRLLLDEHYAGLKPYLQALGLDATTAQEESAASAATNLISCWTCKLPPP